jgi:hypothetical protein
VTAPTVQEIAEVTARLRRIQQLGAAADPVERAAAIEAKRDLLARIEASR